MQDNISAQFDETLARHFERLIGTREGISGLPLNLATISCLVLLAERELEIENVPSDAPERYTHQTLFSDAADVGIKSDDCLNGALKDLAERGYVNVGEDGRFLTHKPALSMAQLLNVVFPKMPGMSFLAYAGQALDEVMTDRTEIGSAIDRFDQTLKMHGVTPGKQKSEAGPDKKKGSNGGSAISQGSGKAGQKAGIDQRKARLSREEMLSRLRERAETVQQSSPSSQPPDSPKIIIAGGTVQKPPRREEIVSREPRRAEEADLKVEREEPPVQAPPPVAEEPALEPSLEAARENQAEVGPAVAEVSDQKDTDLAPVSVLETVSDVPAAEVIDPGQTIPEQRDDDAAPAEAPSGGDKHMVVDDAIERRIADFEKRLALICPLCRERELTERSTAAGKVFYVCPDEVCGFISWGRPHHVECARCKNPFMVEATSASGETILKCPRATCQYRRSLQPVRKVVRRRVVRRK